MAKEIIGIAGSGAMGTGIAQVAATAGHKVFVYDNNNAALQRSKTGIDGVFKKLVGKNKLTEQSAKEIFENIQFTDALESFSQCRIVIEAVVENIEIKQQLFSSLEKICSAETILATNTSSLSITSVASSCKNAERIAGIHFFNPAPLMPLVEIIPALQTRSEVVVLARKIVDSWGKVTVIAKDTPGFIVNRIARPFYGEAIRIYEEGIADFASIDDAMKKIGGFKMGPFELMDMIGNDVNFKVTETVWQQMFFDPRYKPSITQKRMYEAGLFGRKSGKGYYDYSANAASAQVTTDKETSEKIFFRIICMLINEAADALYLNIASKEDIETAMTKGVNYPKGLLRWADELGIENVLKQVETLYMSYLEDRYRPSILLRKMAEKSEKFFT